MKIKEIIEMEKQLENFKYDLIDILNKLVTNDTHISKKLVNCAYYNSVPGCNFCEVLENNYPELEEYRLNIVKGAAKDYFKMKDEVNKWLRKEVE